MEHNFSINQSVKSIEGAPDNLQKGPWTDDAANIYKKKLFM